MSKRKRLKSVKVKISDDDRESLESLSGIDDGKIIRKKNKNKKPTQLAVTCSQLTIETLEQSVKYVQS